MQSDLSDDGLHPNAKGYRVMSPVALEAIGRVMSGQPDGSEPAANAGSGFWANRLFAPEPLLDTPPRQQRDRQQTGTEGPKCTRFRSVFGPDQITVDFE